MTALASDVERGCCELMAEGFELFYANVRERLSLLLFVSSPPVPGAAAPKQSAHLLQLIGDRYRDAAMGLRKGLSFALVSSSLQSSCHSLLFAD